MGNGRLVESEWWEREGGTREGEGEAGELRVSLQTTTS
jgi:hypothetical protein